MTKNNVSTAAKVLGLRRFTSLHSVTMTCASESVSMAVMVHPGLERLKILEVTTTAPTLSTNVSPHLGWQTK